MVDRRMDMRVVRKMPGAKGTIRDAKIISIDANEEKGSGTEYIFTVGCDRHLRVFDPSERFQAHTSFAATFLKQKLNCLCFV